MSGPLRPPAQYTASLASRSCNKSLVHSFHCSVRHLQALTEAELLLSEYDQQNKCLPWKAWAAGSMITRTQAASDLLARARDRFCQAVVTGKALGELAAESVAKTQAEQAGVKAPAGTFIVEKNGGCPAWRATNYVYEHGAPEGSCCKAKKAVQLLLNHHCRVNLVA